MRPLAMCVPEPGRGSSVLIDLFTEWWPRLSRCDYRELGGSMERCMEVQGARLTKEVKRVLLGAQGGDGDLYDVSKTLMNQRPLPGFEEYVETATYGKIWYDEDVHNLGSVETKFPAIVFNDTLTSEAPLSYEPTNMNSTRMSMSQEALEELISQCVADALVTYDTNQSNGDDSHDSGSGKRRTVHTTREIGPMVWEDGICVPYQQLQCGMPSEVFHLHFVGKCTNMVEFPCTDVESYTQRFQELIFLCSRMVPVESDKVEKYTGGLPDSIRGSKVRAYAARQVDNKIRMYINTRDNHVQQPPYKRQNVARAYTTGPSKNKEYAGTLHLCNNRKFHHNGPCTVTCTNCKRVGHMTRDCRSPTAANNQRTLTCFECRNQGHYRSECLRLKNQNCRNQTENSKARGRAYALGGGKTDQDPKNIADDIDA
nr:hypothetical protein [Tanacetum cinerariifolium]